MGAEVRSSSRALVAQLPRGQFGSAQMFAQAGFGVARVFKERAQTA